jgi:hypothetical protein
MGCDGLGSNSAVLILAKTKGEAGQAMSQQGCRQLGSRLWQVWGEASRPAATGPCKQPRQPGPCCGCP